VAEVGNLLRVEARFRQVLEAAGYPAANGGNGKKKSSLPASVGGRKRSSGQGGLVARQPSCRMDGHALHT